MKPVEICWGTPNSPTGLSRYCAEVPNIVGTCGGDFCCLTIFPIVNTCLSCEDIARQNCAMVPRWPIFGDFLGPAFAASRVQHISDLHSIFALGLHHV